MLDDQESTAVVDDSSNAIIDMGETVDLDELRDMFVDKDIAECLYPILEEQVNEGRLSLDDISDRVIESLNQLHYSEQIECFEQFRDADLTRVLNKSALLANFVQRKIRECEAEKRAGKHRNGSSGGNARQQRMKQICDRSGYEYTECPAYRRYGPPPGEEGNVPQGGEVYVGRIPSGIDESTLIPFFSAVGKIWDLRFMLNPMDGSSRGYCFVQYYNKEDAIKAVDKLSGREIVRGFTLSISLSRAYTKLFVGNVPRSRDADELKERLAQLTDGIRKVTVYAPSSPRDENKNRGYCFVYFDSQRAASVGKKKLGSASVRMYGRVITVEWAEDRADEDESAMERVKTLHVKGVGPSVSEEDIENAFLPYGDVVRVKKVQDYAFVTFPTREQAVNAMEAVSEHCLFGPSAKVRVEFARPWSSKGRERKRRRSYSPGHRGLGGPRHSRAQLDGLMPPPPPSSNLPYTFGSTRRSRRELGFRSRTSTPPYHNSTIQPRSGHIKRRKVSPRRESRYKPPQSEYNSATVSSQWHHLQHTSSSSGNSRSRRINDSHRMSAHSSSGYYR